MDADLVRDVELGGDVDSNRQYFHEGESSNRQYSSSMKELVVSLEDNMSLYKDRNYSPVSIQNIPAKLRKVNEAAFTPRSVSVGPIHHRKPELQPMEKYKWRFLERFLGRNSVQLDRLAQIACEMEIQVRDCYQEPFDNLTSKEFSQMVMLDAIFLLVLLQEDDFRNRQIQSESHEASLNQWVRSDVIHDLMLLENQLPFFVLEKFNKCCEMQLNLVKSISVFIFGERYFMVEFDSEIERSKSKVKHLVDMFRTLYKPKGPVLPTGQVVYNRSATELQEAGVRFNGKPGKDLFKMEFHRGKLTIPTLTIDEHTETLFRNMIAFEQCQKKEKDITSYIIFMDSLIDTAKDVDLLVGCNVLRNFYGDHELVASLFNGFHKEILGQENDEFYFSFLCEELNDYSRDYLHQLKAEWFRSDLRRDYFNTPWSAISVVAAIILLLLTVVQTVTSIVSIL